VQSSDDRERRAAQLIAADADRGSELVLSSARDTEQLV
jgi:hypothetical protein